MEPVNHWQICNKRNVIGDCLEKREMVPGANLHLHKEKKRTKNRSCMDKYKVHFYFSLKENCL
jgi:hypothetical protein